MSIQYSDLMQHYAFVLRQADHKAYEAFLEAFEGYASESITGLVTAPASEILSMQGRAAQTRAILALLANPKLTPKTAL